ncbi:MAG TPA: hypothetical protein VFU86_15115 [Terriglobales bacterium]|nr:hypothetical protein [Terriglobales bacterium]
MPPPPPPPPPTPEQLPAQPPQVSYVGGLLTINAPNSTMNDVLSAVRRVTGATIEKPPAAGNDRVVVHLGPAQPKDVLSALFNGSHYDYIILGPMGQPGAVQRVILTAKSSTPAQSPIVGGRPTASQPSAAQQEQQDNSADTEDMTVPEQNAQEPEQTPQEQPQEQQQEQPATPQPGYPQPVSPEQQPQAQPQQGEEGQGQQPHVKSPEELLRELQQMQQQQQNQQNPQNPQNPQQQPQ